MKLFRVKEFTWNTPVKSGFATRESATAWLEQHSGSVKDCRYVEEYEVVNTDLKVVKMTNEITLLVEEDKYYVCKDGEVVGPAKRTASSLDSMHAFQVGEQYYSAIGKLVDNMDCDKDLESVVAKDYKNIKVKLNESLIEIEKLHAIIKDQNHWKDKVDSENEKLRKIVLDQQNLLLQYTDNKVNSSKVDKSYNELMTRLKSAEDMKAAFVAVLKGTVVQSELRDKAVLAIWDFDE